MKTRASTARHVAVSARLLFKDLIRRRLTLVLLFLVPALFDAVVLATTTNRETEVTLGALVDPGATIHRRGAKRDPFDLELLDDGSRLVSERGVTLVYLGAAAVGFLTCFLAFNLVNGRTAADARLVLCGYRPRDVLAAKLVVLLSLVSVLALYETAIIRPYVTPVHWGRVVAGFFLGGLSYGAAGLLIGAVVKHELEGIFSIVLLINVDVGWLQNPIYYASSDNRRIIESLPGYGPMQLALAGAFTERLPPGAVGRSLVYAAVLLILALGAFALRIRPARGGGTA
jgi:hypothetical protein